MTFPRLYSCLWAEPRLESQIKALSIPLHGAAQLRCQMFWRDKTGNVSSEELPMSEHQAWHYKDGLTDLALTTVIIDTFPSGS